MQVSDETGAVKVMAFNDRLLDIKEQNGGYPKEESIVFVKGRKKDDAIFAETINVQDYRIYSKYSEIARKVEEKVDSAA